MTKTISFGHVLSRNAMRNLKGGGNWVVDCDFGPGTVQEEAGCTGMTGLVCQQAANDWCLNYSNPSCKGCLVNPA